LVTASDSAPLVGLAQPALSTRIAVGFRAWRGSKHVQRIFAVSLFMKGSVLTGHRPGSAIRFLVDGTSCQADIIACVVVASSE
jgi:hypothetical protein